MKTFVFVLLSILLVSIGPLVAQESELTLPLPDSPSSPDPPSSVPSELRRIRETSPVQKEGVSDSIRELEQLPAAVPLDKDPGPNGDPTPDEEEGSTAAE